MNADDQKLHRVFVEIQSIKKQIQAIEDPDKTKFKQSQQRWAKHEHNLYSALRLFENFDAQEVSYLKGWRQRLGRDLSALATSISSYYQAYREAQLRRSWLDGLHRLADETIKHSGQWEKPTLPHWAELAKQFQSLQEQERVLSERIKMIQREKNQCLAERDRFDIERCNRLAGQSLGIRWGKNSLEARRHPFFRELKSLLLSLRRVVYDAGPLRQEFQDQCEEYRRESQAVIQECKLLIELKDRKKLQKKHISRLSTLEQRLNKIRSHEQNLDQMSQKLSKIDRTRHALLVTKSKKNGKKPTSL